MVSAEWKSHLPIFDTKITDMSYLNTITLGGIYDSTKPIFNKDINRMIPTGSNSPLDMKETFSIYRHLQILTTYGHSLDKKTPFYYFSLRDYCNAIIVDDEIELYSKYRERDMNSLELIDHNTRRYTFSKDPHMYLFQSWFRTKDNHYLDVYLDECKIRLNYIVNDSYRQFWRIEVYIK